MFNYRTERTFSSSHCARCPGSRIEHRFAVDEKKVVMMARGRLDLAWSRAVHLKFHGIWRWMPIVKNRHHGTIWPEAQADKGLPVATFFFE